MTEQSGPNEVPSQQPQQVHLPAPMPPHSYAAQFGLSAVPVNNNLGWAIAGLLVCWPFGIPSLIKSLQVSSLWAQGQFDQAQQAADEAKKWGKIAVIVGACLLGLYILAVIAYLVVVLLAFGAVAVAGT
ncbi:hypothetical protein GCM10011581_16760 [Saccharopolyspora subtropica]|uniref:Interferon-induced transmembrane protein n=1 Tax=Saccharopolyspora thermophila TaxID=89367 RepID=A0A917JPE3_9PSEU|nr:CD225/dispanin family protein [Saccharopolyspora subtropica]GGI80140.1 hypothetical protein GCM10011581_16760 [Saccharopolyspora subtropica]